VIAVGNEFSSVEALWSQFENVMAQREGEGEEGEGDGDGEGEEEAEKKS
jgi:DASH complex subunit DAD1